MPQLTYSQNAVEDLHRIADFMNQVSPATTATMLASLTTSIDQLMNFPELGRQSPYFEELRELVIPFGKAGYTVLYHYNTALNVIEIVAIKHTKEQSYRFNQ